MNTTGDTIAAISTPLGEGGIGIIRISGEDSFRIAGEIFRPKKNIDPSEMKPRTMYLGSIVDPSSGEIIDEVLLVKYRAPFTYTRENMVEINCHGGFTVQHRILEVVLSRGARVAEPGEFTKRAFLNGRIDLSQAEAVIDIIRAKTDRALKVAVNQLKGGLSDRIREVRQKILRIIAHIEAGIDFPEEDIPEADPDTIRGEIRGIRVELEELLKKAQAGKIMREGLSTVILGRPNVGKSSLLNSLLRERRAIVTDIPGTTRDIIEEYLNINGIPVRIVDTAGIRETRDAVEKIGVERALETLKDAELVLLMFDASEELKKEDREIMELVKDKFVIVVINKSDLPEKLNADEVKSAFPGKPVIRVSALQEKGIEELKEAIYRAVTEEIGPVDEGVIVTRARHSQAVKNAVEALERTESALSAGIPMEMVAMEVREAWEQLGEITGDTVREDVVNAIFENFCIGK
ncbi:tRNA uridine-5-carboxymethylaminomethyl(34) synthesis GTPase MnmE [Thermosediminibacter litoriperuensis]|uniref:tRNA modification GTPase MnmE n=1 Tax=Thermosediminibacter litoriperuensis TaxID=291989 RepID=A0A5S5AY55_9FIRM|nr:tRNA uridine-5-carboxymethylaminomethyl(34) synthesis GTPase MnmE [Thermosediminibacter litoriperuensis]TYP57407.1 tRNA modification GTPase trmE [Thermosediminibacter litoriperuensis]